MTSFCKKQMLNFFLNFALCVNALLRVNQNIRLWFHHL